MNERPKHEIEELLNALVDEEASERQKTEFKRLLQHEPSLADQLASLRQQKSLLNALPIDTAPATMADDVRAALERRFILGDSPASGRSIAGVSHLLLRRALTVAAMLLLPLGLLGVVVFEIIKPHSGAGDYVPTHKTLAQDDPSASGRASTGVSRNLPFDGTLVFATNQQMTVSNYVEKMIFDQGLLGFTLPTRADDSTTYQITAPPEKILELVDSLTTLWPRCRQVTLSVPAGSGEQTIDIPAVQPEQIKTLAQENSGELISRLAARYASANLKKDEIFAAGKTDAGTELTDQGYPPLNVPILTGRYSPAPVPGETAQPSVKLRIQIKRAME